MSDIERATAAHYGQRNLGESILAALRRMGKDVDALQPEDLAAVDAFHARGRAATQELARFCKLGPEHRVLDVGCGLGGTARYLALESGCHVTGLDLVPAYVQTAQMLTERLQLTGQVDFRTGSALAMPYEDASFDAVWSEHAQMNIADKPALYGEMRRVLKPGGRLAFHDVLQAAGGEPHYPLPWARDASHSVLIGAADLRRLLLSLGFDVKLWEDKSGAAREALRGLLTAAKERGLRPLGMHLLIGSVAEEAQANFLRNLEEGRVCVVQAVLEKVR